MPPPPVTVHNVYNVNTLASTSRPCHRYLVHVPQHFYHARNVKLHSIGGQRRACSSLRYGAIQ